MEVCLWIRVKLIDELGLISIRVSKNTSPPIHLMKGCPRCDGVDNRVC